MDDRAEDTLVRFHVGDRSFERVFQEESLDAFKDVVRRKLRLAPNADVQLARFHGPNRQLVDLEDENDFIAFRIRARRTHEIDVDVVLPDGEHPDAPPRKKQRTNVASNLADAKPGPSPLPPVDIEPIESTTAPPPKPRKRKQPAADAPEESSAKKRKTAADNKHATDHVEPTPASTENAGATTSAVSSATQQHDAQATNVADASSSSKLKGRKKKTEHADAPKVAATASGTIATAEPTADASTSADNQNLAQVASVLNAQNPQASTDNAPEPKPKGRKKKAGATATATTTTTDVTADTGSTGNPRVPKSTEIAAFMHELNKTRTVQSLLANMQVSAASRDKKKEPRKRRDSASASDASATTDSEHGDDDLDGHWKGANRLKRAPRKKPVDAVKEKQDVLQKTEAAPPPPGVVPDSADNAVDAHLDPQVAPPAQPEPGPAAIIDLTEVTPPLDLTAVAPTEVHEAVVDSTPHAVPKTTWSRVACPVCNLPPFHLRYKCPVVRAGPESVERRLAELRGTHGREATVRELEHWLEKYRTRKLEEHADHDDVHALEPTGIIPGNENSNASDENSITEENVNVESATTEAEAATANPTQAGASSVPDEEEDSTDSSSSSASTPVPTAPSALPAPREHFPLLGIDLSGIDLASQDPAALLRSSQLYIPDESVQDETSPPMELADSEAEHERRPRRSLAHARDSDSADTASDDDEPRSPAKRSSFVEIGGGRDDLSLDTRGDRAFSQALRAEARLSPSIILRNGPDVLATQPSEAEEDAKGVVYPEPQDEEEETSATLSPKAAPALLPDSPIETFTQSPRKAVDSPSRNMQVFVELPVRPQTPRKPITYAKKNRTSGPEGVLVDDAEEGKSVVKDKEEDESVVEDSSSEVEGDSEEDRAVVQLEPATPRPTLKTRSKATAARTSIAVPPTPDAQTTTDNGIEPPTTQKGKGRAASKRGTAESTNEADVAQPSASKRPAPNASARRRAQVASKEPEVEKGDEESDVDRGRSRVRGASLPASTKRSTLRKRVAEASQLTAMEEQPEEHSEPIAKKRSSSVGSRGRPRLSEDVKAQRQREKDAKAAARQAEAELKRQARAAKEEEKKRLAQEKKEKAAAAKAAKTAAKAATAAAKNAKSRVSNTPESEDDAQETLNETQTSKPAASPRKPRMSLPSWTTVTELTTSSPTTQHGSLVDQLESQTEDMPPPTLLPPFTQTKTQTSPQMSSMDEAGEVEASLGPVPDDEATPRPAAPRSSPGRRVEPSSTASALPFASQPLRPKRRDTRGLQGLSTLTLSPHQPAKPKPKPSAAGRHTVSEVDRLTALVVEEDSSDDDDADAKATPSGPHARVPLKARRAGVGVAGLGRNRISTPRKL